MKISSRKKPRANPKLENDSPAPTHSLQHTSHIIQPFSVGNPLFLGEGKRAMYLFQQNYLMSTRHERGTMPWDRTGNRLLVKSQLGANKPTNYDIPDTPFVYGDLTPIDPEQAQELMYRWQQHKCSQNPNVGKEKDIIETNKQALKNLLHTSSQFSGYRKTNTRYKTPKVGTNLVPIRLPQENHAYGKPLELQDPVRLVIANNYGQDDKLARQTFYAQQSDKAFTPARRLSCHITKNHHLLKEATEKRLSKFDWNKKEPMWKLNKFKEVGFKVETRRRAQSTKQ